MNRTILLTAIVALGMCGSVAAQNTAAHSYVPPQGFVPDSATAVRIAEAVWVPIYGAEQIASERPFVAALSGDVWTVIGSLPTPSAGYSSLGGVAVAEIARQDGRILRVSHGR